MYGSIAYLYSSMLNYEQAENYYIKMKNACSEMGNTLGLAHALAGLSHSKVQKNEYDKALEYAEEAYRITVSHPDAQPRNSIDAIKPLASAWRYHDIDKALKYAEEALAIAEEYDFPLHKSDVLYEISCLHYRQGNYAFAERAASLQRMDGLYSRDGAAGEQGSGLGLIVCREMLAKHGTTLQVESEEGKGSRFWFELSC